MSSDDDALQVILDEQSSRPAVGSLRLADRAEVRISK